MIDLSGEFGKRVERRLRDEMVIWLTTVGPKLTPQPRLVWFLWKRGRILTYSRPEAYKIKHIEQHTNVALNFNSDRWGEELVVLLGEAEVLTADPPATEADGYIEKYRQAIARLGSTPEQFARDYSTAISIEPFRLRGF